MQGQSGTECRDNPQVKSKTSPCFQDFTWGQSTSPIWNTSLFLRIHAGTFHNSNPEQLLVFNLGSMLERSMSPIQNTSLFLRLHAGAIYKFNPEHLLVFKALRRDKPWVQYGKLPCFKGSTRGRSSGPIRKTSSFLRLHTGTIHESNPEHVLVFKDHCGDDPRV